jgi:hypothetical protein
MLHPDLWLGYVRHIRNTCLNGAALSSVNEEIKKPDNVLFLERLSHFPYFIANNNLAVLHAYSLV